MGPQELLERWLKSGGEERNIRNNVARPISPAVIDAFHANTHKGTSFHASLFASGVAGGGSQYMALFMDEDHDVHLRWACGIGADGIFELYENPTLSSTGTAHDPRTRNRTFGVEGAERAYTMCYINPTPTNMGYNLTRTVLANLIGGAIDSEVEWVLRRGNVYLLRAVNLAGQSDYVGIDADWYEEDWSPALDGS